MGFGYDCRTPGYHPERDSIRDLGKVETQGSKARNVDRQRRWPTVATAEWQTLAAAELDVCRRVAGETRFALTPRCGYSEPRRSC